MNISVSFGLHAQRQREKVNECGNEERQALNIYLPKSTAGREDAPAAQTIRGSVQMIGYENDC